MPAKVTALSFTTRLCLLLTLIALTGCGVRVEVFTPVAPTPTPRPLPNINYDLGGIWRIQANPHVSFNQTTQVTADLFMQREQAPIYLLTERTLWLVADYDVTWYEAAVRSSAQTSAQIRVSIYTRPNAENEWEAWDTAERLLTSTDEPSSQRDNVNVTLWYDQPQLVEVRAEVSVTAYLANGETVNTVDVNEFKLFIMTAPFDDYPDPSVLYPGYGDLNPEFLLFDWRNWQGGPCALQEQNDAFAPACAALESGDPILAIQELSAVAEASQDDLALLAQIYSQVGLLSTVIGGFDIAVQAWTFVAEAYAVLDRARLSIASLHNLTMAYLMLQDEANAYKALAVYQEIFPLLDDEPAYKLLQANSGLLGSESWRVEEALSYFEEHGLPQQEVARAWIAQINGG